MKNYNSSYKAVQKQRKFGKRRAWTKHEDSAIQQLVQQKGLKQWATIAQQLEFQFGIKGRSGKQCRERWHNHLSPDVCKSDWTLDEEIILFEQHQKLGNKWAKISEKLKGRTDNTIKNHFYSFLRREYRQKQEMDCNNIQKYSKQLTQSILRKLYKRRQKTTNDTQIGDFTQLLDFDELDLEIVGQPLIIYPPDLIYSDFNLNEELFLYIDKHNLN